MEDLKFNPWLQGLFSQEPRFQQALMRRNLPPVISSRETPVHCQCGQEIFKYTKFQQWIQDEYIQSGYPSNVYRLSPDADLIEDCPKCGAPLELSAYC